MKNFTVGNICKVAVMLWLVKRIFVDEELYNLMKEKIKSEIKRLCKLNDEE